MVNLESLDALLVVLRRHGVQSFGDGDLSIVFHPEAAPVRAAAPPIEPPRVVEVPAATEERDRCACGHSLAVEHGPDGCFDGCAHALCATTGLDARPIEPPGASS
jgi:hypothetical protein